MGLRTYCASGLDSVAALGLLSIAAFLLLAVKLALKVATDGDANGGPERVADDDCQREGDHWVEHGFHFKLHCKRQRWQSSADANTVCMDDSTG